MASVGDKMVELFTDMNRQLGEMTAEIRSVLKRLEKGDAKLEDHESRIDALEKRSHETAVGKQNLVEKLIDVIVRWGGWAILLIVGLVAKLTGVTNPASGN